MLENITTAITPTNVGSLVVLGLASQFMAKGVGRCLKLERKVGGIVGFSATVTAASVKAYGRTNNPVFLAFALGATLGGMLGAKNPTPETGIKGHMKRFKGLFSDNSKAGSIAVVTLVTTAVALATSLLVNERLFGCGDSGVHPLF